MVTWGDPTSGGDCSNVLDKLLSMTEKIYSTGYAFAAVKSGGEVVTWGDAGSGGDSSLVADSLDRGVDRVYSTNAAFAVSEKGEVPLSVVVVEAISRC